MSEQSRGIGRIDLVVGKKGTKPVILTLVERKSRKSIYILVKNKSQKEVVAGIKRARRRVGGNFENVFKTITADNGSEFLTVRLSKKRKNVKKYNMLIHTAVGNVEAMKMEIES